MRINTKLFLLFFMWLMYYKGISQSPSFNFHHLTTSDGLSDGVVRAIVQDKYGYTWIGTSYGLNRFDGIDMRTFFSKKNDPHSLDDNFIQSLYSDVRGNLWIGTQKGLCRYDYTTNQFIHYAAAKNLVIYDMHEDKNGINWLATDNGLWTVDEKKLSVQKFKLDSDTVFQKMFSGLLRQIVASPSGDWYFSSYSGIKVFDPVKHTYSEIRHDSLNRSSVSSDFVLSISLDSVGNLWAACPEPVSLLNKISLKNNTAKTYDYFISKEKKWTGNVIQNVFVDKKGQLWITSAFSGLSLYNDKNETFTDYKSNPVVPNSLLSSQTLVTYQDSSGIMWIGTGGYGLSYFNPGKDLFHTILPSFDQNNSLLDNWCRAACEDDNGNLWLGTGKGLVKYDRIAQTFKTFTNDPAQKPVLWYNSVRSLLKDNKGDIWIGTGRGLNRYHPSTGKMDFFDNKQGMPISFFWMMAKDKNGEVWIGSRDGLYHYLRDEDKFDDLSKDKALAPYAHRNVQALFADSHDRLWISLLDVGVVEYDIIQQKVVLLTTKDSLISDTRGSSFAEDKNGIIWMGSEEGMTAYDPQKRSSRFFSREHGLPSNRVNNLMVDDMNRLWIGTSNGLCMMTAGRDSIRRFDVNDGLFTNQFNEQSAFKTTDGLFIFPTYKGFLTFNPARYQDNSSTVPVYITSFKVSEKELITGINTEMLQDIKLKYDENFFSINLAGLNYMNPLKCTYAYKLEPFDKDWVYTNKREIKYTNVPAGNYIFRYKVITDNANSTITEKTLHISIAAVFYKTWWFRLIILLILLTAIISIYRYRINHREKIYTLQNKAYSLEKEKALVMYETLKQQLNPHFLFNSLTSLGSLISSDPVKAKQFLEKLSKIYRYILKSRDSETVPLIEEIKLAQIYTELQQTRFVKGLEVNINVNEEYYQHGVAPVTLQNLIENAIKHNVIDADTPLIIDIFNEDATLVVRNNLQRKNFVETSNKQGMASMQSLYNYLSGKPILITEDEHYFIVKIPLL